MCPSHYSELFRRYIKLISPSTIWTNVLSFTPFLLPFFHYTSQTRCLQCFCGSLLSRVLTPTYLKRRSTRLSDVPLKKKKKILQCFYRGFFCMPPLNSALFYLCPLDSKNQVQGPHRGPCKLPGDPQQSTFHFLEQPDTIDFF